MSWQTMASCVRVRTVSVLLLGGGLPLGALSPRAAVAQADQEIPPPLELVAPGVVSTSGGEAFPTLSPDGRTLYFATHERGWTGFHIVSTVLADGRWTAPRSVPFDSPYNDRSPFLSPDGKTLFYASDRPMPGAQSTRAGSFNLWYVSRSTDGGWSDPRPVPDVNSRADDFHPAVTADGTLYFSSNRSGGLGQYDLYRAPCRGDRYGTPVNLGSGINTPGEETDVYVSPDDTFLLVVATDRPGGMGGDDLWLSARQGERWADLVNLGAVVNSASYEYGPFVSPDHRYLYFTTHRRGLGDVVRVEVASVAALAAQFRPE